MAAKFYPGKLKQSVFLTNENCLKLNFDSGQTALAIRVDQQVELTDALKRIGLGGSRSVLVIVGGASNISEADFLRIKRLFTEVLAPIAVLVV